MEVVEGGVYVVGSYWEEGRGVWRTRASVNCEDRFDGNFNFILCPSKVHIDILRH